ncbi:hypothetical protein GCM10028783_20880 [Modestobacter muralis]
MESVKPAEADCQTTVTASSRAPVADATATSRARARRDRGRRAVALRILGLPSSVGSWAPAVVRKGDARSNGWIRADVE